MAVLRALLIACLLSCALGATAGGFSWTDTQGRAQNLSDYRGKWVLVNFWATWCSPCLTEIPDLIALHKAHKDKDLVVIGMALDSESPKTVLDFIRQHAMSYPVVLGDYKMARQIGEVDVLPTTYLFDPSGKLVSYHAGLISREDVEEYIRSKK
jgi:thiol-disulfide isomerase/thioredoxin